MPNQDSWQLALSEYIRQGEPDRAEKSAAWQTAIGLQAVDGLKTSPYLLETAKAHIEGDIDIAGAQRRIQSYYKEQANRKAVEAGTMEADIVSARITELLGEKTFQFSPAELAFTAVCSAGCSITRDNSAPITSRKMNGCSAAIRSHTLPGRASATHWIMTFRRKSSSPMKRFLCRSLSAIWQNLHLGSGRSILSVRATHAQRRCLS